MKTTSNSNIMNMNKLCNTKGGRIMKTTRTITMKTIAATLAALSMMSTITMAVKADEITDISTETQILIVQELIQEHLHNDFIF